MGFPVCHCGHSKRFVQPQNLAHPSPRRNLPRTSCRLFKPLVKRTEFHGVLDRRISGQDFYREILPGIFDPTALANRLEPERDRFVEAFGANFGAVLDSFGIADGDPARAHGHERESSTFALLSLLWRVLPKTRKSVKLDQVGAWSELKLEILKKYATAYSTILTARKLHHIYVDAFAGAGQVIRKRTNELILGSPLNALQVQPSFREIHLIDLDQERVAELRRHTSGMRHVYVQSGDANRLLLTQILPTIRYEDYRRALCILDPYGLHLDWNVIAAAAQMKTVEIFLSIFQS